MTGRIAKCSCGWPLLVLAMAGVAGVAGVTACTPTATRQAATPGPAQATTAAPTPTPSLVISGATVIDVTAATAAAALVRDQDVVIVGTQIMHVGPAAARPAGARVLDGSRLFLVPGLWDMHVHTADPTYLARYVAHGVTGVRDMGGASGDANDGCGSIRFETLQQWRSRVRAGEWLGPEMLLSGAALSGTGSTTSLDARTPALARAAVASQHRLGVDFLKVYDDIPLAAYDALAAEARARGLTFAGHLPADDVSLAHVARAGQRSIEHVRDPLLVCFAQDRAALDDFMSRDGWKPSDVAWGRARFAQCPDAIDAFRTHGTWLVPTLTVERAKVAVDEAGFRDDARRDALPASVRAGVRAYIARKRAEPPADRTSDRLWWATQQRLVRRMHAEGVGILAGTDSACEGGLPGASLHEELRLLVGAGLTPLQSLQSATLGPARYLGREDRQGALRAGMDADIVALAANPLDDIGNTTRIEAVVLRGQLLTRQQLADALRSAPP